MKLKFDSNLQYQQEVIASVTDLFEGLASQGAAATQDLRRDDAPCYVLPSRGLAAPGVLQHLHASLLNVRLSHRN